MNTALVSLAVLLPTLALAAPADDAAPEVEPTESILAEYVPQAPPDRAPPPYTLLRYTESYAYLADPTQRRDVFDQLKYIALGDDAQRYLSLGGELRERFETLDNASFGPAKQPDNPSYVLHRVVMHADLHVDERLRFFAQGLSALQIGQTEDASAVNQNPIDLQQGFADYTLGDPYAQAPRVTTRLGRFEMTYGSGRLIATRAAPNVPFRFDGLQWIAAQGSARLYGFLTHPVREYKYRLDTEYGGRALWGVYGTALLPTRQPTRLDVYYLGARYDQIAYVSGNGAELRHSVGLRGSGTAGAWDYDWEPVLQFGHFADRSIRAWTLASDTGYRVEAWPWHPRLGLKLDAASGDHGAGSGHFGGFNPLYFKAGYFNDASVIRPTNVIDIHPSLQLSPNKNITLTAATGTLWRYSLHDGVYAPSGGIELRPVAGVSRAIGQTAEAALGWKLGRHVSGTLSYVHLFASDSAHAAGGGDVDYFGSWLSLVW